MGQTKAAKLIDDSLAAGITLKRCHPQNDPAKAAPKKTDRF